MNNKCRTCRKFGEKLFLKGERCSSPKCGIVKRNFGPGDHGSSRQRKKSEYGLQLQEKQKAKKYYGLLEKQFRLTYAKASKKQGDAGKNFLRLLEMRLDNVVFRAGISPSHTGARQLVSHGHITVNGKKVNIPSFTVKPADVIGIKKKSSNKTNA